MAEVIAARFFYRAIIYRFGSVPAFCKAYPKFKREAIKSLNKRKAHISNAGLAYALAEIFGMRFVPARDWGWGDPSKPSKP